MLYGLHGSYWLPIYDELRSPVLVDALIDLGYDLHVFTSASMNYPEFRSTAWVRIEDQVEDELTGERPGGRDDKVRRALRGLAGRASRPLAPVLRDDRARRAAPDLRLPRAGGGVRALDARRALPGALGHALGGRDPRAAATATSTRCTTPTRSPAPCSTRWASTASARTPSSSITGDHGEEFYENGHWGHTSNFTPEQVARAVRAAGGPGIPPGDETRPTSHIDVPATLLELLGADPAQRADWTLGGNLLDPPAERWRVAAGWDTLGLIVPGAVLVVPMSAHGGAVEVYDEHWRPIDDDAPILRREAPALGELARECRRFLR